MTANMVVTSPERGHGVGNPLFRTKSIERILADSDAPEHRLKRSLTAWDLTGLGIGAIIGTGIFVLIGTAIVGDAHRPGAGPGIVLSFILSGITCALAALCYAEFAAMIPVAGSAYTYSYATLGEFLAWLTGWNLILEYGVACVAVAIGWSGYFNNILKLCGLELPYWATHPPGADGGIANIPAAIIVLLVTGILIVGVKESARATCGIVLIKLAVIVFFIAVGTSSVDTTNWTPFMPFGFAGVGAAAAIVFFAYIGFDAVSTTAEEAKNPQRDLPIGIFASLGICTLLYIAVAAVLTGLVPFSRIDIHAPVADRHRSGRSSGRDHERAGGDDAGPDSRVFRHVPRWASRSLAVRRASEISHTSPCHLPYRHSRGHHGRLDSHWRSGRYDKHRNALRLRPRLYRNHCASLHQPEPSSAVSHAIHAGHSHAGRAGLLRLDVFPSLDDLDPVFCVDGHRNRCLRHVRHTAQQTRHKSGA